MHPVAVARAMVNGAVVTAYENGYAVYEADGAHTVLDVNRCGDYRYDFTDAPIRWFQQRCLRKQSGLCGWLWRVSVAWKIIATKISRDYEEFALVCDGSDWTDAAMIDFMEKEKR